MSDAKEKKEEEKHVFAFECVKKRHKFELQGEGSQNTQFDIPKMRCPVCQGEVMLSMSTFAGMSSGHQKSLENVRKENRERSNEAMRMASEHRQAMPREETVTVNAPKGSGGRAEAIPKSVIDSIEQKAGPELQE